MQDLHCLIFYCKILNKFAINQFTQNQFTHRVKLGLLAPLEVWGGKSALLTGYQTRAEYRKLNILAKIHCSFPGKYLLEPIIFNMCVRLFTNLSKLNSYVCKYLALRLEKHCFSC